MTTFMIIKSIHKKDFLTHINSVDKGIQVTVENTKADGIMPFLDTMVTPQTDGSLTTTVFRKPNPHD